MSARKAFGNQVGDIQVEMSNSTAHYQYLSKVVKQTLLDEQEERRAGALEILNNLRLVYDTKYGTSRLRKSTAPLLYGQCHPEQFTQSIITADEVYLVLLDEEGKTRMAYLCGLEQAVAEGFAIHPFKFSSIPARQQAQ
jgi:hypothetical protein